MIVVVYLLIRHLGPFHPVSVLFSPKHVFRTGLNPFRAPEPLPILNSSNLVPKNGFPVAKGLSSQTEEPRKKSGVQPLS